IIRNLKFQGPGSIDVGGADLLSFVDGTKHCWVDHCDFMDGMDGNFDITQSSDFNTVSWCTFSYTSRSYMHQNTNLIGSSDSEAKTYLNTTFAFNHWGTNCKARMPMARVGKIHMLNNYYTCTTGGNCINPRKNSEFLIEGNYFAKGVKSIFGASGATAVTWKNTNYSVEGKSGESSGSTVTVPYSYTVAEASKVPTEVGTYAGATLFNSTSGGGDNPVDPTPENPETPELVDGNNYIVASGENVYNGKVITCKNITMTYGNDGNWSVVASDAMASEGFSNLAGGNNNPKDASNKNYSSSSKNVPTTGTYYVFTPTSSGTLYVASYVYTGKVVYVTENGSAISFKANGTTINSGNSISSDAYSGYITFPVTKGKTYYLFGEATKIKLYGFNFVVDGATAISTINENKDIKENRNGVTYNLAGQVVDSNYRGLVIINNKVVMR
ncbi:MAG: hypothetical protein II626_01310, partial [Prevotella sp.]|nr:hypothetical protein [Prevotella sp.]